MLLTRRDAASLCSSQFKSADEQRRYHILSPWRLKTLPFMDHPLDTFYVPTSITARSWRIRARRFYERHDWAHARPLRPIVRLAKSFMRKAPT